MTEIEFEKAIEQIKSIPLFSSELDFYIALIKVTRTILIQTHSI